LTTRYGQTVNYNGLEETRLLPDNKMYFSINNENDDPYGVSVLRSIDFVAQTLVTIQNSMKNQAERFGDPMYHVHLETTSKSGELETQRKGVETNFNQVVTGKRTGKSGDLVTAGGPNSKVTITVIGHDGQVLEFEVQTRHLLEMIISKFHIPSWLLGIYWSTTERMATLEIEAALADARIRQFAMLPGLFSIFSSFLRLRGRSWKSVTTSLDKPGDWGIIFETPNLRDTLALAQARFLNAQADQMGTVTTSTGATPPAKSVKEIGRIGLIGHMPCSCGGQKELQRTVAWPDLDKVETDYETTLKTKWSDLKYTIMTILKLAKGAASSAPTKDPGDLPGIDAFSFTEEQRAQIMQAYKNWLGQFNITDPNSPLLQVYGEAYSLGLIQAVHMIGKERPILDIIKNKDVFDQLASNGFELVKSNTTDWFMKTALPEMQAQMLAGTNPLHVADRLAKLFSDQDVNWERLARTEMSGAAESAKLAEWKAWEVDISTAVSVPVHPRCRCSNTIEDDGSGKFRAVFSPAPDACPICVSLVT
jgi:hypothetical protein